MIKSILDYLENSVSRYPNKIAVIDSHKSYTYEQLADSARRVGSCLKSKKLRPNQPVVVLLDKEADALPAFFGITYAGGIYAPIDAKAPNARLQLIIDMLNPAFIITKDALYDKATKLAGQQRVILLETALKSTRQDDLLVSLQRERIDADPLYIISTSGSTGIPKGVVISHRAVIDFVEEASEEMDFSEKEIFANQAPFYFDASVPDLYCTIRNAATLHILTEEWFSFPIKVLQYIRDNNVNAIFWVPTALIVTANLRALNKVDITCLKKIMFCGEVMPVKQYNMWKKAVPDAKYVNYYGPSETTYASTYYVIDRDFKNEQSLPIGNAAVNTGVLILNEKEQPCIVGEIGELCIRGSGVALGYYNSPEKTESAFVQNPLSPFYRDIMYRTGDLVRINEYSEIEYIGRKDFQIKHMGYRIELGEIESAAMACSGVERACCIYSGNHICIYHEGTAKEEELKEELKCRLPEYMIPDKYIQMDKLPLNANGKVDRILLKDYKTK